MRVWLFPGQSSVDPQMLDRARTLAPDCEQVFADAVALLRRDPREALAQPRELLRNRDVQVGVFLCNHLHLVALASCGLTADRSLGLSLGEYNHLVHIGALGFEDGLRLVDRRGAVYDEGPPGIMACVFPCEPGELEPLLDGARGAGEIAISNYNSPTQQVVAGARAAVEHVIEAADAQGWQSIVIEHRIPMHMSLFAPVADRFREALEAAPWRRPRLPYLPNVLGRLLESPGREDFIRHLTEHVFRPVLWRASLERVAAETTGGTFVEVGPRTVISNMVGRRWLNLRKRHTDDTEDPRKHFDLLVRDLHAES